ncbi:hypothetical protein KZ483_03130 [Paenibacillus sp. sptzw28]|uniref:hypothetical protein n=1 Tax=Paenibacillus sp. sptzw28 TaxID=715179 RepID=UPI001C6ED43E|nr:hypothetical protein [Paenibacillus sp. sptzw28]QYR22037.1 hypothetical protein KZ483_03130 [Paenibacillus sp. sptzw28]
MNKLAAILLAVILITALLSGCNEDNELSLSAGHDHIQFVSLTKKDGYSKAFEQPDQISVFINAIEKADRLTEVLYPITPNRTPDEDYFLQVHYDPAVEHEAIESYFVWVDDENREMKIAPIQEGKTYLYKLNSETAQEVGKLLNLSWPNS